MPSILKNANLVLVANKFNVTLINQLWLIKKNLIPEPIFESGQTTQLGDLFQLDTKEFTFSVVPDRLVLTIKGDPIELKSKLEIVRGLAQLLPETPYVAIGANFNWSTDSLSDISEYGRANFSGASKLFSYFQDDNARFGTYASIDFKSYRMRLDIKPSATEARGPEGVVGKAEFFSLNFNFNKFLHDSASTGIEEAINDWEPAFRESQEIANCI